jgi:hypothetical protein
MLVMSGGKSAPQTTGAATSRVTPWVGPTSAGVRVTF